MRLVMPLAIPWQQVSEKACFTSQSFISVKMLPQRGRECKMYIAKCIFVLVTHLMHFWNIKELPINLNMSLRISKPSVNPTNNMSWRVKVLQPDREFRPTTIAYDFTPWLRPKYCKSKLVIGWAPPHQATFTLGPWLFALVGTEKKMGAQLQKPIFHWLVLTTAAEAG